jgi:hypothetical protein
MKKTWKSTRRKIVSADIDNSPRPPGLIRTLLKRDGWPVAGIALVTVTVQLSVFLVPGACGVPTRTLVWASLIIAGVWVALASAIFAAGPRGTFSGLLRGGCVVDATAVLLIVLWLRTPQVTFASAVKLYCIYASVAFCSISAARCAATRRFRYLGAVFTGAVMTAMQGSLFWLPGLLQLAPSGSKSALAGVGLRANPLYGVFSAIADESGFVWHYAEVMYRITPLGEDIAVPPVQWYEPMTIYLVIAGVLAFAALLRSRRLRSGSRGEVIGQ